MGSWYAKALPKETDFGAAQHIWGKTPSDSVASKTVDSVKSLSTPSPPSTSRHSTIPSQATNGSSLLTGGAANQDDRHNRFMKQPLTEPLLTRGTSLLG